jgi:hypothetical protein
MNMLIEIIESETQDKFQLVIAGERVFSYKNQKTHTYSGAWQSLDDSLKEKEEFIKTRLNKHNIEDEGVKYTSKRAISIYIEIAKRKIEKKIEDKPELMEVLKQEMDKYSILKQAYNVNFKKDYEDCENYEKSVLKNSLKELNSFIRYIDNGYWKH